MSWRHALAALALCLLAGLASAAPDTAQIEQGAYLARVGNCMGCHTQAGGQAYAGGRAIPTPFGTVFAPNLTPDPATGLGRWNAEDFWNALHHGRSRDGRLLSPAFPYDNYTLLSRADSDAIHAYLRSLPAVVAPARAHGLRFPYNTQAALWVWRALFFRPGEYRPEPGRDPAWNRGAYLSQGLAHCSACHGPRNALGARPGPADFSGAALPGMGWYAPSLHDRREAGVVGWAEADLMQWLKTGTAAPGSALGPMAEVVLGSTRHLSEPDLRAMARYLQSLPPQARPRPPAQAAAPALRAQGRSAYLDHCASCHGRDGEGRPGAYPALRGNRTVLMEPPTNLLRVMLQGGFAPATPGHPRPYGMPPFAGQLNEAELAAIASYIRQAWGNQAGTVQALQVLQHKATR